MLSSNKNDSITSITSGLVTELQNHQVKKQTTEFQTFCTNIEQVIISLTLTTESIESPSLSLESINDIHGGDCLPPSMLRVSNGITNDILKENLKNTSCFFVDQTANPLNTSSSCKTTNCRFGDALNVVSQHLPVTLRSSFAQALSTFSTT